LENRCGATKTKVSQNGEFFPACYFRVPVRDEFFERCNYVEKPFGICAGKSCDVPFRFAA